MKHIVLSLLVSLVSLGVYADDDLVEYCRVNFKQDFTVYADYGEQSSSFYSQHKGRISKNKWDFDDEVLFFASNKKNDRYKDIAVWTSDDDDDYPNVLFYDPSVDKEPGATIRIDYDYQGHSGNAYYGDITYYVYKSGQWSESVTKTLWTHYTSHKAYAVFEHEEDDDELHNLRCGPLDEKPVVPDFKLDICPYVPNTVQTNYILPSGNPFGALQVGASNYVQLGKSETELFLSSSTGYNDCIDGDGNLVSCKTMLTNTKPAVDGFPKSLGTFPNTGNKPDKDCKKDNLRDCYLTPGVYKDVKVAEDATLVLAGGRYYFSILKFEAEGASLQVNGPTEINYKEILFEKSDIKINVGNNAKSENLLFLGHGDKANFYLKSDVHNVEINAYIYVDKRADDKDNGFGVSGWRNTINGGVTSHSIAISGGSNYINATNQLNCTGAVEPDISAIEIVPTNMYLQCADNKVYVKVFDKDGKPIQNIGNSLVNLYSTSPNALSFTRVKYDAAKSWFEFTVDSKANNDYGPIEVKANVVGHDAISDTSHLVFAPVVFDINDGQEKELIAGYPDKVSIKALACSTDGNTIVGNYEKTISEKNLHNTSFIPGSWQNNSNKLTLTAAFKAGQVAADIQFNDAGRYKGQLIDTVKCQDFYRQGVEVVDCPITESKQIIGELKFKARPWSFALCRPTLKPLPNGDINDPTSEHFVAAGESFAFAALPIRWQGGNITGEVATLDSYCDKGNITENFSLGQAGEIALKVTHDISLPSGGELGELSGNVSKTYTASEQDGYYLFDSLSWNEVGQLKLMVDSDDYWDMDIQQGYRNVGRFYPYRFAINKSEWQAPASQGDVTYLSQPFANVAVKVEALTLDDKNVKNYDDFAEPLQAKFTLWQESNSFKKNKLQLNVAAGQWREDSDSTSQYSYWELDDSNAKVLRYRTSALSAPLATKENGPFNTGASGATSTDYALQVDGVDPVFFSFDEAGNKLGRQAFIYQPKLRYGRMVLGHLGGVSGTNFNVPLRVEYWNGSKFVVNQSDDASGFLTADNYQCKKPLWQSTPSNSTSELAGADSFTRVKDGLSDALMANADSDKSLREQVQFWLKLDDLSDSTHASPQTLDSTVKCGSKGTNQPWLQYNWHGLGDEDPSTVVTFGIYRGNDKIIFRSEEGLTGL
ncbi:hypothetical protein BIY22_10355 [Vibrio panuliri]|uniref:DUF6701 domain-containing protein n=1 Tax=Vibrio panuliri TaxID=1381081 RepID=A0A1Q9HC63_9VIBR|nr:DUF6701 domain-containing protein [Vibrio panuliri]OLQ86970.1 hypothetical protein BIY22_10355 [Vibrio panuliri]